MKIANGAERLMYLNFEKILESNLGVFSIIEIINTYIRHPLENELESWIIKHSASIS